MPPRRRTNYAAAANRQNLTPPAPATTALTQIRTKPVRITIDLDPALYERVKHQVRRLAADAGRDVPLAAVTRALFTTWLDDDDLAKRVHTTLTALQ